MFDLQVLAFATEMTRVSSFKMGRDVSARVFPESGVTTPFHALSHHGDKSETIEEFARLNRYHVEHGRATSSRSCGTRRTATATCSTTRW